MTSQAQVTAMATLPATMQIIDAASPGGPEQLVLKESPLPQLGAHDVLIKVAASGVNRADILQRLGKYPSPPGAPTNPGLEASGTIVAVGNQAKEFQIGDAVCALLAGGGYAEYCAVHEGQVLPIPRGLDLIQGAALAEAFFTVWSNVFEFARLQPGEALLVHGGTSGIGVTAIQLASAFGATVYATAGSAEKCEACRKLGAARAINYREEDFVAVLKAETGGKGVNLILDMVGGDYVERNILAAAEDGRIHQIAFQTGSKVTVDLMRLMLKRVTLTGSTLRPRPMEVKGQLAKGLEEQVWPLLAKGEVKPVIDSTFPLAQASEAHRRMEMNAHIGKIILTI